MVTVSIIGSVVAGLMFADMIRTLQRIQDRASKR